MRVGYSIRDEKVGEMLARIDEMTIPPSEKIDPGISTSRAGSRPSTPSYATGDRSISMRRMPPKYSAPWTSGR